VTDRDGFVPVIDLAAGNDSENAAKIDAACRKVGFFAIHGHGVAGTLLDELEGAARAFFALSEPEKETVAMVHGGLAWRGWFPLGGELTSGRPDAKEGYYFGRELPAGDPRPLHGPNLWPAQPQAAALRDAVEAWMAAMELLGQRVLRLMARGLGLPADFFAAYLTADPVVLLRIFRYPPLGATAADAWSVGEHTDYGLLTLLAQDGTPGLEVRVGDRWIAVPSERDLIVCNLGDMLDRMTGGRYRSTPHRVRNTSGSERLSFPFFCDPGWDADVRPIALAGAPPPDDAATRWDGTSLRDLDGTYGEYLWGKVAKVFPALIDPPDQK
jgi:isopenicillin N synthase-like dioxygenase